MADPGFELDARYVGGLPVVNRYLDRLNLGKLLEKYVPSDPRTKVPHARVLGVMVRNLVLSRTPLYGLREWAENWVPTLLGLDSVEQASLLNDDRGGRALDRLFDVDRVAFLTELGQLLP